jgi:hypothetical protein
MKNNLNKKIQEITKKKEEEEGHMKGGREGDAYIFWKRGCVPKNFKFFLLKFNMIYMFWIVLMC